MMLGNSISYPLEGDRQQVLSGAQPGILESRLGSRLALAQNLSAFCLRMGSVLVVMAEM